MGDDDLASSYRYYLPGPPLPFLASTNLELLMSRT